MSPELRCGMRSLAHAAGKRPCSLAGKWRTFRPLEYRWGRTNLEIEPSFHRESANGAASLLDRAPYRCDELAVRRLGLWPSRQSLPGDAGNGNAGGDSGRPRANPRRSQQPVCRRPRRSGGGIGAGDGGNAWRACCRSRRNACRFACRSWSQSVGSRFARRAVSKSLWRADSGNRSPADADGSCGAAASGSRGTRAISGGGRRAGGFARRVSGQSDSAGRSGSQPERPV